MYIRQTFGIVFFGPPCVSSLINSRFDNHSLILWEVIYLVNLKDIIATRVEMGDLSLIICPNQISTIISIMN